LPRVSANCFARCGLMCISEPFSSVIVMLAALSFRFVRRPSFFN